jgi:hypothetical protein
MDDSRFLNEVWRIFMGFKLAMRVLSKFVG